MFKEAIEIGHTVVDKCSKKGMDAIEIFYSYNNEKQVAINGKSISSQIANEELGAGIRVIHQQAEGFSYTNIITKEALMQCAEEAFTIAKLSPHIEGLGLAAKQKYPTIKGLYSKEIAELSAEKITQDGIDFIKGFTGVDDRIQTILSQLVAETSGAAVVNSLGVEAERKSTSYQAAMLTVASDENKSGAYAFDNIFSRKHDVDLLAIGKELGQKAIDNLDQKAIKSFNGPVIFQPEAIFNPIAIVVGLACSADWRQRGRSFWKDKLADKVTNESFQFTDKPHDTTGADGVRPFDDEGNATKEIEIVKDGILQTFLHNQRTANKENLEPTGNALRSLGGGTLFTQPPGNIFPNSPHIATGDMSEEEMIEDIKKGIIFHNYQGSTRFENGIFSGVAKGAYLIENGEITSPVTGISISGNVFEILNNISGIGKQSHISSQYLRTPWLRFEGIKISTK
jgi:PmbA protein